MKETIQLSIDLYSAMLGELEKLENEQFGEQSQPKVTSFNITSSALHQGIRENDQLINSYIISTTPTQSEQKLLNERTNTQRRLVEMINKISSSAQNAKSLLASEIQGLKNGRKALSGYKSSGSASKQLIHRAF